MKSNFGKLLEALRGDFQSEGTFEEWLVLKIAEGMWRLRRATRSENGSVRDPAIWDNRPPEKDDLTEAMDREVDLLTIADEQIQAKGTLSEEIYEKFVGGGREAAGWPAFRDGVYAQGRKIDNEILRRIRDRKTSLKQQVAR